MLPAWYYFVPFVVLDGMRQGIITWLFREYVPTSRLDWINAALHAGGVLAYALVVWGLVPHPSLVWVWALLTRWLLFDLVLTATWNYINYREHRPRESLFSVGTSALTDRLTRWVAGCLHLRPTLVRLLSTCLGMAGLIGLLVATEFH